MVWELEMWVEVGLWEVIEFGVGGFRFYFKSNRKLYKGFELWRDKVLFVL